MDAKHTTYEYIYSSPSKWKDTADRLIEVAKLLEGERDQQSEDFLRLKVQHVYYMLIGFALENYYKGIIIGKMMSDDRRKEKGILDEELRSHDLLKLARQAQIEINEFSESQLNHLKEYALWKGRYPLPIRASDIGNINYNPPKKGERFHIIMDIELAISIEDVHRLITQAREKLLDSIPSRNGD